MDDHKGSKRGLSRIEKAGDVETAGERKRRKRLLEHEKASKKPVEPQYDVGSTSYELMHRLAKMEELEGRGSSIQRQKRKKDIWRRLAEEVQKRET
jgi:hypothetical protein